MVTQPSHAALAGELAAKLAAPQFPTPDGEILQAISLHDAGWGILDAEAIKRSTSTQQQRPRSFLATSVPQVIEAWRESIQTCESLSPAGGYVVSRHFHRLAEHQLNSEQNRQKLESFLGNEVRRQKRLAARQSRSTQQLEELTDLLQFFDLLSLYICSGARQNVVFPMYFGVELRITRNGETYKLAPSLSQNRAGFALAALRYPATQKQSSRKVEIEIE
jgi:hypothetical protein